MGKGTSIEWCDDSDNPVMGCDGCELWIPEKGIKHCYAGSLHQIRAGNPGYADKFEEPKLFPGRMAKAARRADLAGTKRPDKPWLDGMPRMIFVSDMGDALSRSVPFEYLCNEIVLVAASKEGQRHLWLWLTKQPARMAQLSTWLTENGFSWPKNLWAGTSITSNAQTARVRHLLRVPAAVRFLSMEPLLEAVDLDLGRCDLHDRQHIQMGEEGEYCSECSADGSTGELSYGHWLDACASPAQPGINWVIVGGESGTGARPFDIEWARKPIEQCREAGVPVFVKQLGSRPRWDNPQTADRVSLHFVDRKGGDWSEWPEDLRVREVPRLS